jgi:hypothetical protein
MNTLSHTTIQWPDIPQHLPREYNLSSRKDFRVKQLSALAIISKGFSLVTEIRTLLSQMPSMSPNNMSTYRAIVSLDELINYQLLPLKNARSIELGVVSLNG